MQSPSLPPSPREVCLSQGTIRYRELGSGPPIVFVHGALVNSGLWRDVAPLLADRFRCVLPDLPLGGHLTPLDPAADCSPRGQARLIAEFLAALDLRGVCLVGNDTGGALCQLVIADHAERVDHLVLTNCDAFEHFPPALLAPLRWGSFVPGFAAALAAALRTRPVRRLLAAALAHRPLDDDRLDAFFDPLRRDPGVRRDLTKFLRAISRRDTLAAAHSFPRFDRPVLIAWGEDDLFFPRRDAERLADLFPRARLVPVAHSRTYVPIDQPDLLARLIAEFLRQPTAVAA